MSQEVHVHLLPSLLEPSDLAGSIAVVIDVLRASTTMTHALAVGADRIYPCEEVDEARRVAQRHRPHTCLLGGERKGRRIEGFDLDNSPLSYTHEVVGGKQLAFTTTNGTHALLRAKLAQRVLLGCFVNLRAVVRVIQSDGSPVHVICAGTDGEVSAEDCLCAGAVAYAIRSAGGAWRGNDEAELVVGYYESQERGADALVASISESRGGRNLTALGYDEDIRRSACLDLFDLVPEYFAAENVIRAVGIIGSTGA